MKPESNQTWQQLRTHAAGLLPFDFAERALQLAAKRRKQLRGEFRTIYVTAAFCLLVSISWNWFWGNHQQSQNRQAWNQFLTNTQDAVESPSTS